MAVAEGAEDCPAAAAAAGADAVEALGLAEVVVAAAVEPLVLVAEAAAGVEAVAGAYPTVVAVDPLTSLELGAEAFEVVASPWLAAEELADTLLLGLPPVALTAPAVAELLVDRLPLFCAEAAFDEIDPCACEETALSGAPRDASSIDVFATADISAAVNGPKRAIA